MKLLDKIKNSKVNDFSETLKEYFHGTNISDAESMLTDGYMYSFAFRSIISHLNKQGLRDKKGIEKILQGLYDLLPLASKCDFDREQLKKNIRDYARAEGLSEIISKIYSRRAHLIQPEEELFLVDDWGVFLRGDAKNRHLPGYLSAADYVISKSKDFFNPEGVIFQANLPFSCETLVIYGWFELENLRTIHILSKNPEVYEKIQSLSKKYSIDTKINANYLDSIHQYNDIKNFFQQAEM